MFPTKIALVSSTPDDLDTVLAIEESPENSAYIGQWKRAQHEAAIADPNMVHLKVVLADRIVGYLILIGISDPHKSIQLKRIAIAQKGHGFGRQAIRLVKEMVFNRFDAHRLWLDVMVHPRAFPCAVKRRGVARHNIRAEALYLSEGFVEEGILRQSLKQKDRFIDLKVMSILEPEYRTNN